MDQSKKLYTTHDVARLIGVTPITVIRWIEGGKLKCYTTLGGHRRIEHSELIRFAQAYNLPWRGDEELENRKEFVVMAVDDEEDVLEILSDMLGSLPDLRFIRVSNGFSAAAKLVEEHPDLILLDFLMPELDGFEFCQFVRQDPRFRDMLIVAVTGLKADGDLEKIKSSGVNDIISKPFAMEHLLKKIDSYRKQKKNGQQKAA